MWEWKGQSYAWEYEEHCRGGGERRQGFLEDVHLSTGGGDRVGTKAGGIPRLVFGLSKDTEDTALDLGTLGDLREWSEEVGLACKPSKGLSAYPMGYREP